MTPDKSKVQAGSSEAGFTPMVDCPACGDKANSCCEERLDLLRLRGINSELLEALKYVDSALDYDGYEDVRDKVKQAITKAGGC